MTGPLRPFAVWHVWRDGIQHQEARPWAAETHHWILGLCRFWFATWHEAFDFASAHTDEDYLPTGLPQPPREFHVDWPGAAETP